MRVITEAYIVNYYVQGEVGRYRMDTVITWATFEHDSGHIQEIVSMELREPK